ncbi:MAG TPA: hypothetical protein VEK08_10300, partial [Planctomycetota bacterium]|nr:hypothetical protein [Planctomycetota bacterium]
DVLLTYLGPQAEVVTGASSGGGIGLGTWNFVDEPVTKFVLRGHYNISAYPDVKFNETWEVLRKKLLEIPGVKGAQLEPVNEDEKTQKPDTKVFEAKIFLQDDSKPLTAVVSDTPAADPRAKAGPKEIPSTPAKTAKPAN